jgi:hypothetical protein
MVVVLFVLFLIVAGIIVAYYLGHLDKFIKTEPPMPMPIVTPVVTPVTTSAASSDTPPAAPPPPVEGAFPEEISGLSGRYTTDSFNDSNNSWADMSPMGNHILDVKGDLKRSEDYVHGSKTVGLKFPIEVFGPDNAYTMFYVARYDGPTKRRIFDGVDNNWLSGFWGGKTGVAHHKGWLTQGATSVHGPHAWVIATDAPNKFRTFGEDRVINKDVYNSTSQITVNMGANYEGESSDWAIKEVIFYNRLLNLNEIARVEAYLIKKYRSELPENLYGAKGYVKSGLVEDPRPIPYGYGTPEFCRQQAISLGYPVWGHRNENHPEENKRNKCFYYTEGAFDDFDEKENDKIRTIGCVDLKKDVFSGCPE